MSNNYITYCKSNSCTSLVSISGTCCDGACITCGDCDADFSDCYDAIEVKSLFDDLSHQPEKIKLDTLTLEIKEAWPNLTPDKIKAVLLRFGRLNNDFWEVSVLARAYVIDCLDDVSNNEDIEDSYVNHFYKWAEGFVLKMRAP